MRDLNENLDDQFREAVDRYSLKPLDSRWDELSGKIISMKRPSTIADPIRSKYRKWTIWLVLLVLMPIAFVFLYQKTDSSNKSDSLISDPLVAASPAQDSSDEELQRGSPSRMQTPAPSAEQTPESAAVQTPALSAEQTPESDAVQTPESGFEPTVLPRQAQTSSTRAMQSGSQRQAQPDKSGFSMPSTRAISIGLIETEALLIAPVYTKTGDISFDKKEPVPLSLHSNIQKNLPLQHLDIPRRRGFYLGLETGPMLTQVKSQGLKKSGFDVGLLAGYAINKKFSIETGLLYTHQYYFVGGKYYNEFAGINYAVSLEGSRNAFEIPLNVKYNLIRRAGGNFFIAAGASTFVGVNDKVLIHVADGAVPPAQHFDYGVTSWLPSYVNLSVGYEYKIGKSADIRIEPYFQIPLNSNTGNSFKTASSGGSIQVFNAGIHIGISQFIR
jgi:hypothetical protein